jgi:hypothetical protein
VTAVATGAAVITAECEGISATAAITVTQTMVANIEGYFGITIGAGDTASLYFVPRNAAGQVVTNESFVIAADGSEVQAGATQCSSDGCLQPITTSVFANLSTVPAIRRTVTIRPSAVPPGSAPSVQISVTLLGILGDSLVIDGGGVVMQTSPRVNLEFGVFPYLAYPGGRPHLRNTEISVVSGSATIRRCIQGSGTANYQSHCMSVKPTVVGPLTLQLRQRKADGSYWTMQWTGQVIP